MLDRIHQEQGVENGMHTFNHVPVKAASFPRHRYQGIRVFLDSNALDASAHAEWTTLIELASRILEFEVCISSFSGIPPDDGVDFVFVSDSAALSRKMWLNASLVYIQPRTAPIRIDAYLYWKFLEQSDWKYSWQPVTHPVTLISSVFRSDEFLPGFLENCAGLRGYENHEHFLIRAGSPGDEHGRLVGHVRQWPAAVYLNLARDPGLYEIWNLGTRLATGRYLSNANIDDRRASQHLTHLQAILDRDRDVDVASTALRVSKQRNLAWEDSGSCPVWFADSGDKRVAVEGLFKLTPEGVASRNLPNCMPLWRRSLHARVGRFDEKRYGSSADWAFWVRAGMHGAQFFLSAEPLGLYLRDEESYWHRDPANQQADQCIVAEYLAWVDSAAKHGHRHCQITLHRPLSQEIGEAIDLLRSGAVYEGMGRLLKLASSGDQLGPTGWVLVNKVAERFFGCNDFQTLVSRYGDACGPGHLTDIALFNVWVDLVHALGSEKRQFRRTLELACFDLDEYFGDSRGLLLFALLAHKQGRFAYEQLLLRHLHETDSAMFWSTVQQVYRFIRPLPGLCESVSDIYPRFEPARLKVEHQVVFYPNVLGNAYQDLLYRSLRTSGGVAWGTSDADVFLHASAQPGAENILHIHWINRLFRPGQGDTKVTERKCQEFHAGLMQQKQRGFKVFWTVHNYLSHETSNPEDEVAFRQALYNISDRVFIHHPLAADLLDWLPDRSKLCLCEHGHYDLAATNGVPRSEARDRLGLAEDDFVVTHLGNIRDYKGLIELLPLLLVHLAEYPKMKLMIGGGIRSHAVKSWLAAHPHPNLIIREGFLSEEELICHMRAADVGLLSYGAILTSGSLVHWLSSGRPVLAPMIGTIPAYLVEGWNGYGYRDVDSLRRLLNYCAGLPGNELERLGDNARVTAQQMEWRMWGQ